MTTAMVSPIALKTLKAYPPSPPVAIVPSKCSTTVATSPLHKFCSAGHKPARCAYNKGMLPGVIVVLPDQDLE